MKSRITIDINESNEPIIQIEYISSEDVRDKMVKRFLERFGGESSLAYFTYIASGIPNSKSILKPIKPEDLEQELTTLTHQVKYLKDNGRLK